MGSRGDPFVLLKKSTHQRRRNTDMSDHLIAEANRHAKALPKMTLPTTKPNDRDLAWYIAECIDLKKQLKMECAAKREHLRIACAEINELKVKAAFHERENAALRELTSTLGAPNHINVPVEQWRELRADKERLDWMEKMRPIAWALGSANCGEYWLLTDIGEMHPEEAEEFATLRAAIDAARKEAQP
jgi:hypothetical protein